MHIRIKSSVSGLILDTKLLAILSFERVKKSF